MDDQEVVQGEGILLLVAVKRSEAILSTPSRDCFVAVLLAVTGKRRPSQWLTACWSYLGHKREQYLIEKVRRFYLWGMSGFRYDMQPGMRDAFGKEFRGLEKGGILLAYHDQGRRGYLLEPRG